MVTQPFGCALGCGRDLGDGDVHRVYGLGHSFDHRLVSRRRFLGPSLIRRCPLSSSVPKVNYTTNAVLLMIF